MNARHLVAPLLAIAMLAGCTVVPAATPSSGPRPIDAEPSEPTPIVLDEGTVVATGPLTSVDGLTTGSVTVTADGSGQFEYVIDVSSPVVDEAVINLTTEPFTEEAYCANGFTILVMGQMQLAPEISVNDLHWNELTLRNPDYLDTLVLTSNNPVTPKTGCFYPVIASAPLTWTMPDLRPDLDVVDSGATGGATGPVTQADGKLASYEVVAGDVLEEIAARFGISVLDLFYLNPARGKGQQRLAFTGELLNLSKSGR